MGDSATVYVIGKTDSLFVMLPKIRKSYRRGDIVEINSIARAELVQRILPHVDVRVPGTFTELPEGEQQKQLEQGAYVHGHPSRYGTR